VRAFGYVRVVQDEQAERFKWAMLRVSVGEPWNLAMAWGDAFDALPGRAKEEVDRVVSESLTDLFDAGYIYFFRASSFEDEWVPRTEEEGLSRAEVVSVLAQGSRIPASGRGVEVPDWLVFRATERGREHFDSLPEEASRLFSPRN
jgi:hypothetical protein